MATYSNPGVAPVGARAPQRLAIGLRLAGTRSGVIQVFAWCFALWSIGSSKLYEQVTYNGMPGYDSGVFATIGLALTRGQVPYRDLWDHKPPGIYFVDALLFSHLSPWAYHLAEIPVAVATAAAFYLLARQFAAPATAAVGAALCGFLCTSPILDVGGNLTETYLLLPLVAAYALAFRLMARSGSPPPGQLASLGLLLAAACLFKPQALADLGLIEGMLVLKAVRSTAAGSIRNEIVRCAIPAVTCVASCAAVFGTFVALGAGPEMVTQLIGYNAAYAHEVGWTEALHNLALRPPVLPVLGMAALAAVLVPVANRRRGANNALVLAGIAWWLVSVAEVAADRHFWAHDFLLAMPSSAALITFLLQLSGSRAPRPAGRVCALLGFSLVAEFLVLAGAVNLWQSTVWSHIEVRPANTVAWSLTGQPVQAYGLIRVGDEALAVSGSAPGVDEVLARAIIARTNASDTVFIWGTPTGAYVLSGRKPASRFLYDMPLTVAEGNGKQLPATVQTARTQLMHDLARSRPRLIAIQIRGTDAFPPPAPLQALLRRSYRVEASIVTRVPAFAYTLYVRGTHLR